MANKNDLRYIKTEKLIEETYLHIKKKDKQVKVTELCEVAMINKSTFYTHYETMNFLHESICRKTVRELLVTCPSIDLAFIDTSSFVKCVVERMMASESLFDKLFGSDIKTQTNYIENALLDIYLSGDESFEEQARIIFAIGGAARLLFLSQDPEHLEISVALIKKILA